MSVLSRLKPPHIEGKMTTISEILLEDAWRYLKSLKNEEIIELADEHRRASRYLAANKAATRTKIMSETDTLLEEL